MPGPSRLKQLIVSIIGYRPASFDRCLCRRLKLQEILGSISGSLKDDDENVYARSGDEQAVLLVLITSNRGLCGAFNANAIKASTILRFAIGLIVAHYLTSWLDVESKFTNTSKLPL